MRKLIAVGWMAILLTSAFLPIAPSISELSDASMWLPSPCPGGTGVVGGRVFGDFNYNGLDDQHSPLSGVQVYLFECGPDGASILLDSMRTDGLGQYFFSGLNDGTLYRLEFIPPEGLGYIDAPAGADHSQSVQIVTAPTCEANAAFTHPQDYAIPNPNVAATCYVNGDPLLEDSEAHDMDVLVMFNWTATGNSIPPDHVASAGELGACYGLAWDRNHQLLYASAFVKRHVGLGPLGLGGIYRIDMSDPDAPQVEAWLDLEGLGIDCGILPSNTGRGLPLTLDGPSNDPEAYGAIGKQGLGGLDYDPVTDFLWVVNLYDGKVYRIDPDSDDDPNTSPQLSDIMAYGLPDAGCNGGSFRPFAIKAWRGNVYVGGVCDAAISQDTADLEAIVFRLLANDTFEEVVRFDLSYPKGYASNANNCENFPGWYPWLDVTPPTCDAGATYVYPQPILADIAFDIDGAMIVGFMDRAGHQLGFKNWPPTGTMPLMSNISGGEMLRLGYEHGHWVLEHNATAGVLTTAGANNGQGPGGGEFYYQDIFQGPADNIPTPPHAETSQGDLAFWPGAGAIATTALDPYSTLFNSGGVNWMDNITGEVQVPGYVLYRTSTSTISTFSKANGLGAIEAMVMGRPPMAVGGHVWHDLNNDGVQDPCEPALANIQIGLYDVDGNLLASTVTDGQGQYSFSDTLLAQNEYYIVAGLNGQFDPTTGLLNGALYLTQANVGMAPNPDKNDSDALPAGLQANGAFAAMPFIAFTPTGEGFVSYDLDFGFGSDNAHPVAGIGGFVWLDDDGDGIQDVDEMGLGGVAVALYESGGSLVAQLISQSDGTYFFPNVVAGDYYLSFDATDNELGLVGLVFSPPHAGDGTNDSDADPMTGQAEVFAFDPSVGDELEIDAGFYLPKGTISGYVWADVNGNGVQEAGEEGVAGVAIQLYTDADVWVGSTVSAADGTWSLIDVMSGQYYLAFDPSTNANGVPNYQFSPQDVGDDATDSDVDPTTGTTPLFTFDPTVDPVAVFDAGLVEPQAGIGGRVWVDDDGDGLQDAAEEGVAQVTVQLLDASHSVLVQVQTDVSGNYFFSGVVLGIYYLHFDPSTNANGVPNYQFSPQDVGPDDQDSDVDPLTGNTPVFVFDPLQGDLNIDAGLVVPRAAISGRVWQDVDQDGLQGAGEQGIAGVTVELYHVDGSLLATNSSDAQGYYQFEELIAGQYVVKFDVTTNSLGISDYTPTIANAGDDTLDSDIDPVTQQTPVLTLDPLMGDLTHVDAGYVLPYGEIVGRAWLDCDADGLQDTGEDGLPGVPVMLSGNALDGMPINLSGMTDAAGNYFFSNLPAGNYEVTVAAPASPTGLAFSPQDAGNELVDSDVHSVTGSSGVLVLSGGVSVRIDVGFIDVQPPQFDQLPADEIVSCSDPQFNDPPQLTATDNLGPVVISFEETTSGTGSSGCVGDLSVVRTWTAIDQCGQTTTWTQILTVGDQMAPYILNIPDLTVECGMDVTVQIKVVDDCDASPQLTWSDEVLDEGCPQRLLRTYVATDACGNSRLGWQKLTLVDTMPPIIQWADSLLLNLPQGSATLSVACDQMPVFDEEAVVAWDDCADELDISVALWVDEVGQCDTDGYVRRQVWRWVVTDPCGNQSEAMVEVLGIDQQPPELIGVPSDQTISCTDDLPPAAVTAIDYCDEDVELLMEVFAVADGCSEKIIRQWTAIDDCGQTTQMQQVLTVVDDQPPVLVPVHSALQGINHMDSLEFSCEAPVVLSADDVMASDECSEVSVEFTEVVKAGDCSAGYLLRLVCCWTATDACDNADSLCVVVRIVDETPPELGMPPADTTVVLWADELLPAPSALAAYDACDDAPQVEYVEDTTFLSDGCDYLLTRNWTATDQCGNSMSVSQQIVVDDLCFCPDSLVQLVEIEEASCGQADGSIVLTLALPAEAYEWTWVPVFGQFENGVLSGLPAGQYLLTATVSYLDVCELKMPFEIPQQSCADTVWISMEAGGTQDVCLDDMGVLDYPGAITSATFCESGTNETVWISELVGPCFMLEVYPDFSGQQFLCVVHCTSSDCDTTWVGVQVLAPIEDCDMLQLSAEILPPNCQDEGGRIALTATGLTGPAQWQWVPAVSDSAVAEGLSSGTYSVYIVDLATGCMAQAEYELEALPPYSLDTAQLEVQHVSCPDVADGRIEWNGSEPLTVWRAGEWVGVTPLAHLPQGEYVVVGNEGGCADTVLVVIEAPLPWAVSVAIEPETCAGNDGIIGVEVLGGHGEYVFAWDPPLSTTQTLAGVSAGSAYSLTISDAAGCNYVLDSLEVPLDCPLQDSCGGGEVFAAAYLAMSVSDCDEVRAFCVPYVPVSDDELWLDGELLDVSLLPPCSWDTAVVFSLAPAWALGEAGPWMVTDWPLDGTVWAGPLDSLLALPAFVQLADPQGQWQWQPDEELLMGRRTPVGVGALRLLHVPTQSEVVLEPSLRVVPTAVSVPVPVGVHELVWRVSAGVCVDTMYLEVVCTQTEWIADTLKRGDTTTHCMPFELAGPLTNLVVTCVQCDHSELIVTESQCFEVRAWAAGADQYLLVGYDNWGLSDTLHYVLHIRDEVGPWPQANSDRDTVQVGQVAKLEVLANDFWNEPLMRLELSPVLLAQKGEVRFDGYTLVYEANRVSCGMDRVAYELCDRVGCDTAIVELWIRCPSPAPYSGFSPNGDGINDVFIIEHIELWPRNSLTIFNRWGEEVFHAHPYHNDWDGTFGGLDLPDGTYFYLLEYGQGQRQTGYVQIRR